MKNIIERSEYKQGILRELTELIKEECGGFEIPEGLQLTENTNLFEDLGMEEFDKYELEGIVKHKYQIPGIMKNIETINTIRDYIRYIAQKEI